MQLPGQSQNSADRREEDDTDHWDGIVSRGYLSGTGGYLRRISGVVWSTAENRAGDKSQKSGRKRELYGGVAGMISVNSIINIKLPKIQELTIAQIAALEQTAEALHTEVVQAQVIPFDDPQVTEEKVYGKRGRFSKNGKEYKGKIRKKVVHGGGHLQNDSTFVDYSQSGKGKVTLVSNTPYARRLYFHPEYHFDTGENPHARGRWYEDWLPGGSKEKFCQKTYKEIYRRLTGL